MPLSQDIADVLGTLPQAISGCTRMLALEYLTNINKWLFLWWESELLLCGGVENDPGPWNKSTFRDGLEFSASGIHQARH